MKTKLITTIIISLLVASFPICSANPARSLIKIGGKIIKGSSKGGAKVVKVAPKTPPKQLPELPPAGDKSPKNYVPIIIPPFDGKNQGDYRNND